jgi:AcrR family transcriptional regulator
MNYLNQRVSQIRSSISDGRDDLVRENRRKIANSAARLFRKKGFHKTAIRDIAVEMGVSQGHIYQYISRKEDILLLMLEMAVDDYNAKLFCILDEDSPADARLVRAIETYYRIIDRHRDKTSVLYNHTSSLDTKDRKLFDMVEVDVTNFFKTILDEGIQAGTFEKVDTFLLAYNIVSLGHMWALKYHRFKGVMSLDEYVAQQTGYVRSILAVSR